MWSWHTSSKLLIFFSFFTYVRCSKDRWLSCQHGGKTVQGEEVSVILCSVSQLQRNIKMRPPPVVTGISPAEGPPGTKVIIRGEHLGVNAKDVTGSSAKCTDPGALYVWSGNLCKDISLVFLSLIGNQSQIFSEISSCKNINAMSVLAPPLLWLHCWGGGTYNLYVTSPGIAGNLVLTTGLKT